MLMCQTAGAQIYHVEQAGSTSGTFRAIARGWPAGRSTSPLRKPVRTNWTASANSGNGWREWGSS